MKIRTGFVSNSRSSSFVLIVKKELHEKLKETLHPYVIAVMDALGKEKECLGNPVMVFANNMDRGGESSLSWTHVDYDGEMPEEAESPYDAWEIYQTEVEKHPGEFFSNDEDF